MNLRYYFTILLFLFISSELSSQSKDIQFEHITITEGLPHDHIYGITQDHLGFLWFTTPNGLVKYDGFTFKTYIPEPDNPYSIPTRLLFKVLEDIHGFLWVSSLGGGLIKFDRKTEMFINYLHDENDPNSLISNDISALYQDTSGVLWIGTMGNGLEKYNKETETFTHFRHNSNNPNSLSNNEINTICEDQKGNVWIGTNYGLNKFDKETGNFVRYYHNPWNSNSLVDNGVTAIFKDNSGILWIGTSGGLSRYNLQEKTWKNYQYDESDPSSLSGNYITAILQDRSGNLWIGTIEKGLNKYNPDRDNFTHYITDANDPTSINGDWISDIFEDRSGVLWIGCQISGLNKVDPFSHKFTHFKHNPNNPNSLSNNWVWSICEDRNGILWIGTHGGGLNRFNRRNGTFRHYTHDENNPLSLSSNIIEKIYEDHNGDLWMGTDRGLNKYNRLSDTFSHYFHEPGNPNSLSNNHIFSIFEDSFGELWVGTRMGLNRIIPGGEDRSQPSIIRYQYNPENPQSLSFNKIQVILQDSEGILWFGSDGGGLEKFNRESESFQHYFDRKTGFDFILNLLEDTSGRFWIATYNGALHLFDRKTGKREIFTTEDGLPHRSIKGILEDDAGNLWLSTLNGLSKFDYNNKTFYNYDASDGLQSNTFHSEAACKGNDGRMYFGGINGFNCFFPDKIINNPFPPQIVLTDLKLFNKSLTIGEDSPLKSHINSIKRIILSHNQNDILIEYAALHFSEPDKNIYAVKLENYDDDWRHVGNLRVATYTNLNPGEYIFRVKAANCDNIWNEEGIALRIIIKYPYWQTLWFRVLVSCIILVTVITLYRRRINTIEEKKKELEKRVEEKTEAAQALQNALNEVEQLKNRLQKENIYLQEEIKIDHDFANIICVGEPLKKVLRQVEQVAATDATVLILGETGTGKDLIARAIHNVSNRKNRPLVKVNCAALPPNLIESELFGHEKGAFTGAISQKIGRFELADGGTIFLDEIGELPPELQVKLLRILQDGEFERLGNPKTMKVNVRIIAATNRDLEKLIKEQRFREDLYYRLNVFPIHIPPLRERKEDIPLLVNYFIKKFSKKTGKNLKVVTQTMMNNLRNYDWPGNIRELENVIERAVIISSGEKLALSNLISKPNDIFKTPPVSSLEKHEIDHILKALELTEWRIRGEKGAAKILGLKPTTLESRMIKLGIKKPNKNSDIS